MLNELMTKLYVRFSTRGEDGATAAEYGLLIFLIALAIIVAVRALGVRLDALFDQVTAGLS